MKKMQLLLMVAITILSLTIVPNTGIKFAQAETVAPIPTQREHTVRVSGKGLAVSAVPVQGVQNRPAIELPNGTLLFCKKIRLPDGTTRTFYIRGIATDLAVREAFLLTSTGLTPPDNNAQAEILDENMNRVAVVPAHLQEVNSLTVPPGASRAGNFMDIAILGPRDNVVIQIWFQCSNGYRICVKFVLRNLFPGGTPA